MKKIALLGTTILIFSVVSQAQITKGSFFLGGSFGLNFSSGKSDTNPDYESKNFGWSLSPQIGKAIADNKIVGLRLGFGHSKQEDRVIQQKRTDDFTSFNAGVFYRRYFPLSSRFFLFGEAGADYGTSKQERKTDDRMTFTQQGKNVSFDITPGISYAAARKLHLEASLNRLAALSYGWSEAKSFPQVPGQQFSTSTNKGFGLSGNGSGFSAITIGLRWILPRKA